MQKYFLILLFLFAEIGLSEVWGFSSAALDVGGCELQSKDSTPEAHAIKVAQNSQKQIGCGNINKPSNLFKKDIPEIKSIWMCYRHAAYLYLSASKADCEKGRNEVIKIYVGNGHKINDAE